MILRHEELLLSHQYIVLSTTVTFTVIENLQHIFTSTLHYNTLLTDFPSRQHVLLTDVEPPQCYLNWCLKLDDCLLAKDDDGVPLNVRIAGEDDVSHVL